MYKIIIKGRAFTNFGDVELLDGISCQDNFAEYFPDDIDFTIKKYIKHGYMDFRFEDGELWTYTTYDSPFELIGKEIDDIINYTVGQWSDGIGERFEQEPCAHIDGADVYISPWYYSQKAVIEQIKGES